MGREPVIVLSSVDAGLQAVQLAAVPMPTWAHVLVAAALVFLNGVLARARVTPVTP